MVLNNTHMQRSLKKKRNPNKVDRRIDCSLLFINVRYDFEVDEKTRSLTRIYSNSLTENIVLLSVVIYKIIHLFLSLFFLIF